MISTTPCSIVHTYPVPQHVEVPDRGKAAYPRPNQRVLDLGYAGSWIWTSENSPSETVRKRVWLALRAWILVVDRVKTGRTVPLQVPVRPHFGIFWDFSDSFSRLDFIHSGRIA